jgi:hypothetical protein
VETNGALFGVWEEWLALYVDHCRARLSSAEQRELAGALDRGVSNTQQLARLVPEKVAEEGRWLVDFLAGVDDPVVREALVVEAAARLTMPGDGTRWAT